MISDLQDKLRELICKGINTEAEVVYFLVCVRKIIEQDNSGNKYPNLKFFCNWALHSSLDTSAKEILKIFEEAHTFYCENGPEAQLPWDIDRKIGNLAKLNLFEADLAEFLIVNSLPRLEINDHEAWIHFIHLYSEVIKDCPLKGKKTHTAIRQVSTNIEFSEAIDHGYLSFKVTWNVTDFEGRSGSHFVINSFAASVA